MKRSPLLSLRGLGMKMAVLLLSASLLPLGIFAVFDINETRQELISNTEALLKARGDQLAHELDTFNIIYRQSAEKFARLPAVAEYCASAFTKNIQGAMDVLQAQPAVDPAVRGAGLLDLSGKVRLATEARLIGKDLSFQKHISQALTGAEIISDVFISVNETGNQPTIAYLVPVLGPGNEMTGILALWVHASALWDIAKASNELAGPGSFAVLFDQDGIRIAHTYNQDIVFHPAGPIDPATLDTIVAQQRFGENTRKLLEDVRPFPEQFARARAASPDQTVFRGLAPVNGKWNYGVAKRFTTVPWTVFYMLPEESLNTQIEGLIVQKAILALIIALAALVVGILFTSSILRPVAALARTATAIRDGDFSNRVALKRKDELGQLGASFNAMADRIQTQTAELRNSRDELEQRVSERTAELETQLEIVRTQQRTILEMSAPVLEIRERVLILPIIGLIDSNRAAQINNSVLNAIRHHRAKTVILDITGVPVMDLEVASHFIETISACRLMGAEVLLCGISADMARALVLLGQSFPEAKIFGNLKAALEEGIGG